MSGEKSMDQARTSRTVECLNRIKMCQGELSDQMQRLCNTIERIEEIKRESSDAAELRKEKPFEEMTIAEKTENLADQAQRHIKLLAYLNQMLEERV